MHNQHEEPSSCIIDLFTGLAVNQTERTLASACQAHRGSHVDKGFPDSVIIERTVFTTIRSFPVTSDCINENGSGRAFTSAAVEAAATAADLQPSGPLHIRLSHHPAAEMSEENPGLVPPLWGSQGRPSATPPPCR